jgi:integrase
MGPNATGSRQKARAKRRRYVPVVLSRAEVEAVLSELEPRYRLVALLVYGCGLRFPNVLVCGCSASISTRCC